MPTRYRRPLRHYYWLLHHLALLSLWVLLFLPACLQAGFKTWGDDLSEPLPDHAAAHERAIAAHLAGPFTGYTRYQVFDDNFRIIALSHMAYGYMSLASAYPEQREQYVAPITEIVARALDARTSPYKKRVDEVEKLGEHNLYLSHLNLILGIARHISGDTTHDTLHERLTRHLLKATRQGGDWHARSYPRPAHLKERELAYKWPADQSVTLLSLYLYDITRKEKVSREPIRKWLATMNQEDHRDAKLGLPKSALDPKVDYARFPRGCALSWTVLYMSQFAPEEAATLYERYREQYSAEVLGFGGFREWPPGVERGMDVDSGPIVLGVGVAATGLGLGPARMMRDARQYGLIMRSATVFGLPTLLLPERHYLGAPLIGEAMLFSGATARPWFEEKLPRAEPFIESETWGYGVMILLLILAALIYYSASSVREQWRELRR